ncbi:hypothetical protein KHC23_08665 [Ancylobacter dichloromethanicus]|uniref:Uncharacterized protein n=1 Tax=Ancylobacter dichloromethanicus TaxID=518825 RepID=A0A9W6JET6_9HYPH|nr:hypothetical protein [Ancylobacter dichloromethanicus]MBS7553721.1 hypothetical protein [Ancylobacter dichloromethanicus]GLK74684.1 hypothetical protein GCM10017643_48030 [Ancylobacter dichloromethanicus]
MPYESERNQYKPGGLIWGPARDWYTLVSADIGAKELPRYGRALEIDIAPSVELPVILVVVPVGNMDDAETRTLTFRESGHHVRDRGVRRVVSVAGAAALPAGVQIDVITD